MNDLEMGRPPCPQCGRQWLELPGSPATLCGGCNAIETGKWGTSPMAAAYRLWAIYDGNDPEPDAVIVRPDPAA